MNTITPSTDSANDYSVAAVLRQLVLPLFPEAMRHDMESQLPTIALQAQHAGVTVLLVEEQGLRFAEAVRRPEFLVMGRIYFGASNLLQWQVPKSFQIVLRTLLQKAIDGEFEPSRRLMFAIASRKHDHEAALWRFLLWVAVRLNLLMLTWDDAGLEARGSLLNAEDQAEEALRALLKGSAEDLQAPDFRPLHVLMAETIVNLQVLDTIAVKDLTTDGEEWLRMLVNTEALEKVRALDAKTSAMYHPGQSDGEIGSQQVADRYPQWFPTANALDRSRSRSRQRDQEPPELGNRFIDIIQEVK